MFDYVHLSKHLEMIYSFTEYTGHIFFIYTALISLVSQLHYANVENITKTIADFCTS